MEGLIILQLVFAICVSYQIGYWLYFYLPLIKHLKKEKRGLVLEQENLPPVSVLISAKNESKNLKRYLPKILNQNYPQFEVIVIDDYSTDDTLSVLKNFAAQHKQLNIIQKSNFENIVGKKAALTAGIKQSKYEILLFTDADCEPINNNWIRLMATKFTGATEIVLGYGPYRATPTFLNRFIRYETYLTLFNYAGFALRGLTYMGVGRNVAYQKKIFNKMDGFTSHKHIASGDDDLFISKAATPYNTELCLNFDAWCYSTGSANWASYKRQKRRHVSTANEYKFLIKILLALNAVCHILIYLIFLYYFFEPLPFIAVLFIVRLIVSYVIFNTLYNQFYEHDLWLKSMAFDSLFIAFYFLSFKGILDKKNKKW